MNSNPKNEKSSNNNSGLNLKLNINSPEYNKQNILCIPYATLSARNPYRRNPWIKNEHSCKEKLIDYRDAVKTM